MRLVSMGTADTATSDVFSDMETWAEDQLVPALNEHYGVESVRETSPDPSLSVNPTLGLSSLGHVTIERQLPPRVSIRSGYLPVTVVENRQLSSLSADATVPLKRHLEVSSLENADPCYQHLRYEPGDHVLVLPWNDPMLVTRALRRFSLGWDTILKVHSGRKLGIPNGIQMTASDLLGGYVELAYAASTKVRGKDTSYLKTTQSIYSDKY